MNILETVNKIELEKDDNEYLRRIADLFSSQLTDHDIKVLYTWGKLCGTYRVSDKDPDWLVRDMKDVIRGYILGRDNAIKPVNEPDHTCPQIDKAIEIAHTMADTVMMEQEIDKLALVLKRCVKEINSKHVDDLTKQLNQVRAENAQMRQFAEQFKWTKKQPTDEE